MTIDPQIKYLIEDYVDVAVKFQDILEFYKNGDEETKQYFDECFKKVANKRFGEAFSPLLSSDQQTKKGRKKK
jgi:DNA-binding ferritin-like protein